MRNTIKRPIKQCTFAITKCNKILRRQVAVTVETAMSFYCKSMKRLQLKQKTASKLKPSLL